MKLVPIGVSDYKKIVEGGYYYVDKTLLVKEVLRHGEVILITRPRRFGKTLNLSMLRYFFEKSESGNEHLFATTAIRNEPDYQLMGQFPVISLSFKSIKETTWELCYDTFALIIAQEFDRHIYLLSSESLRPSEKKLFQKIQDREASIVDLKHSLQFLAELLSRHYNKKVIVLIDEYDVPVQSAYVHGYYHQAIDFLKTLLTAVLKDSTILEKSVLTGILTLAKAGIFTDLNNLDVINLTHAPMADLFGFTHNEVQELLKYYGLEDEATAIKEWYDGYTFGMIDKIYNPWSALKCVQAQGALRMYWANTSDNVLVKKLIARAPMDIKSDLELVLNGVPVEHTIEETIIFPDLEYRSELVWSLLLFTGYLTSSSYELKEGKVICSLIIPNTEIRYLYTDMLKNIFQESVLGGQVENLLRAIIEGETDIFEKLLASFVLNSMSVYDLPSNEPEKSYHLFVLGLVVALSDRYEIKSNRESGLGRYDIMIIPKKADLPAIIMEFKIVRQGETLEIAAQRALDQIQEKRYAQELHAKGISQIREYGIAFQGKKIYVKSNGEKITRES